jgi:hypothetical protein
MPSRTTLLALAAAALLATAVAEPNCAGSNVTLGTPADDPEVPHRAPSRPPPEATPAPAPEATPAAPGPTTPPPGPSERSLGDPVPLAAPACASRGSHVRAVVPRLEDLDLSYRGAVPGIEIRRTVRAGTAGYRNARLAGGTLEVDVWARGSGLVAGAAGYETCTGGAAADVSFEIVAHYRR